MSVCVVITAAGMDVSKVTLKYPWPKVYLIFARFLYFCHKALARSVACKTLYCYNIKTNLSDFKPLIAP